MQLQKKYPNFAVRVSKQLNKIFCCLQVCSTGFSLNVIVIPVFEQEKLTLRDFQMDANFFAIFGETLATREQMKEEFRWSNTPQVTTV